MLGRMDTRTAVERLQFTPDESEGVAMHAFYDGFYLASILGSSRAWIADCRGIDLGQFPTRVAAKAAIMEWVSGLDVDEWPAPRDF
jgi:hypothetical protein